MRFHADLHVHSKHSRATSRDLDLEHLAHWAARKGVGVVGTGDIVHPAWLALLKQKLVPAEPGLFRLNDEIETQVARTLPATCRTAVRFMLEVGDLHHLQEGRAHPQNPSPDLRAGFRNRRPHRGAA